MLGEEKKAKHFSASCWACAVPWLRGDTNKLNARGESQKLNANFNLFYASLYDS